MYINHQNYSHSCKIVAMVPYGKYLDKNQTVKLQGLNRGSLQSGIHCVLLFVHYFVHGWNVVPTK